MNKKIPALALCAAMLLTGCSSMLDREYISVSPHPQLPAAADDSNAIRVENYQQLLSALLALVKDHKETGVIRLRNYTPSAGGTVEGDMTRAREEVYHDDPLGNFAIDAIDASLERIVMYYEATITISYRRTKEQVDAVTSVTGSGAIRTQLRAALASFQPETALRVNYFSEDADYIRALLRETYYDTPAAALGMPQIEVALYPDSGFQRIVEVIFTYPGDPELLREKSQALAVAAEAALLPILEQKLTGDPLAEALLDVLRERNEEHGQTGEAAPVSTAYCLVEGVGDSQGLALAYKLLCDGAGVECQVVQGVLDGAAHYWTIVSGQEGYRHVDPTLDEGFLLTDGQMWEHGAEWTATDYPVCGESDENLENTP